MKLADFDFRLWHEASDSFIEISAAHLRTKGKQEIVFEKSLLIPIDECIEIELWTGMKDKNGTKIYDGDILQSDGVKFVLFYKHREFVLRELKDNGRFIFLNDDLEYEVLGNIHENPTLLNGE